MRNLIAVAFLEPVTEGMDFPRDRWPLHITLVKFDVLKFDVVESEAGMSQAVAPEAVGEIASENRAGRAGAGAEDSLAARVAGVMDAPVRAALGATVTVGGQAGFGRGGSIPVSLIEPSPPLQRLHEALVGMVAALPGRVSTPGYSLAGYRPHVSHRGGQAPLPGEQLVLDRIALVDMAPDGGHASRRVLRLWVAT
jgi:hypothetical protein